MQPTPGTFTPQEARLIATLVGASGTAMSPKELLEAAWGWDNAEQIRTKTVSMHVSRARRKIAGLGLDPACIATVHGTGYRYDPGADPNGAIATLCRAAEHRKAS